VHKIRAPERVIHKATVYTANDRRPQATALAVSEGWINGVGSMPPSEVRFRTYFK